MTKVSLVSGRLTNSARFFIFIFISVFLFSLYLFLFNCHYHSFIIFFYCSLLTQMLIIGIISSAFNIVTWIMSFTCLEIAAKICFQCLANLSKLIELCSAWNHQEILIFWWFVGGILVGWIAQFCLVVEENFGDNPLHDYRCF